MTLYLGYLAYTMNGGEVVGGIFTQWVGDRSCAIVIIGKSCFIYAIGMF
jgi:hypothetical protein